MPLPTQKQIDGLASFIEACGELEREPFFGKDERLGSKTAAFSKAWFLGDRFHFRSALISFRRIWMSREPSSWKTIAILLQSPELPPAIAQMAKHEAALIQDEIVRPLYPTMMPAERTIELWLNTVFAHGGIVGKNKRKDFEVAVETYGHASFEFACRQGVRLIGGHFLNLARLSARPALQHYEAAHGLTPLFHIGAAFGMKNRERTADGHVIIRQASSEFFSEETMAARFTRILNRNEHRDLKLVLDHLDASPAELLRGVLRAESFAGLLAEFEGVLRSASMIGNDVTTRPNLCSSSGIGATRVNAYLDNVVETDAGGVAALDAALAAFRHQLIREKSCSI